MRVPYRAKQHQLALDSADVPIFGYHPEDGRPVCGAKTKTGICHGHRLPPTGRCYMHNGSPIAAAGRPVTHGRFSNVMPAYLKDTYEAVLLDTDPYRMLDSIAFLDALAVHYTNQIGKLPPDEVIIEAEGVLEECLNELANYEYDPDVLHSKISKTLHNLKTKRSAKRDEREVRDILRERSEMVKVNALQVEKAKKYVTIEQILALLSFVEAAVYRHVQDPIARSGISTDFDGLRFGRPGKKIKPEQITGGGLGGEWLQSEGEAEAATARHTELVEVTTP